MNTLGNRIFQLRTMGNLSQEQLAEALGVSRVTISRLETDLCKPGPKLIGAICEFFHIDMSYLMNGAVKTSNEFITELSSAIDTLQMIREKLEVNPELYNIYFRDNCS